MYFPRSTSMAETAATSGSFSIAEQMATSGIAYKVPQKKVMKKYLTFEIAELDKRNLFFTLKQYKKMTASPAPNE